MFFFGIVTSARYGIAYPYGMEFCPEKNKKILSIFYFSVGASSLIFISFFFPFISKHWEHFVLIAATLTAISLIGLPFLPESPKYLHAKKRFDEARQSLNVIGRYNGMVENDFVLFKQEEDLNGTQTNPTPASSNIGKVPLLTSK